eukprot:2734565-Rhodomonas_salina.3
MPSTDLAHGAAREEKSYGACKCPILQQPRAKCIVVLAEQDAAGSEESRAWIQLEATVHLLGMHSDRGIGLGNGKGRERAERERRKRRAQIDPDVDLERMQRICDLLQGFMRLMQEADPQEYFEYEGEGRNSIPGTPPDQHLENTIATFCLELSVACI